MSPLELGLLAVVLLALLSIAVTTARVGISPMPSASPAVRAMVELVPPGRGPIVDLGCGWGTLLAAFADRDVELRGHERSPLPWLVARLRVRRAVIRRGDFMRAELSDVDVVLCYLYPGGMERLRPKLEAELPAGALVVSNTFAVPGWTPDVVVELDDVHRTRIYRYRR